MNMTTFLQAVKSVGIKSVAFVDFETTGLNPQVEHPTEVAIRAMSVTSVDVDHVQLTSLHQEDYNQLIRLPEGVKVSEFITGLTGITNELLEEKGESIYVVASVIADLIDRDTTLVVAHSANFDLGYLSEHFGFEPKHFLCTKTVAFLENPSMKSKLENLHSAFCPELHFTQTHRAMDDVTMLHNVFEAFLNKLSMADILHYKNRIVVEPERPLVYTPRNAKVIDLSKRFDRKEGAKQK